MKFFRALPKYDFAKFHWCQLIKSESLYGDKTFVPDFNFRSDFLGSRNLLCDSSDDEPKQCDASKPKYI